MSDDTLFDRAAAVLLAHEGGWTDRGPTNFGWDLSKNPDLTLDVLKAMTQDEARARYRVKWWDPWRWRELPPDIAVKCFDLAVNMGASSIIRCLQRAIWAAGKRLKEDGDLGTITVTACADVAPGALLAALKSEAAAHYRMIVMQSPAKSIDLADWLDRAYS